MANWRTHEQRLAELDRKRSRIAAQKRTAITREKIVLGGAVVAEMRENPEFAARVISVLRRRVKREPDARAIAAILEAFPQPAAEEMRIPPTTPAEENGNSASPDTDPFAALDAARRRENRQF